MLKPSATIDAVATATIQTSLQAAIKTDEIEERGKGKGVRGKGENDERGKVGKGLSTDVNVKIRKKVIKKHFRNF